MEQTGYLKIQSQAVRASYSFLLLVIVFTVNACVSIRPFSSLFSEQPTYFQGPNGYGLQDVQLDESTYFIVI